MSDPNIPPPGGTPPPPPGEEEEEVEEILEFFMVEDKPELLNSVAPVYPEIARKAGVEGRVYVNVLIDERGNVIDTKILKSLGNNGCDEAAVAAIQE